MVEQFKDDFTPIEIDLVDSNGKNDRKKSVFLSAKQWRKALESLTGQSDKNEIDKICEFLGIAFGESAEFFEKYSAKMLTSICDFFVKKMSNQSEPQSD